MSTQIAYRNLKNLSGLFGLPDHFYYQLTDVLIETHNLNWLYPFPGISANSLSILYHIAHRTFPFKKLFEIVSLQQILNGLPSLDIPKCPCAKQTIWRCLDKLVENKLLIKLVLRSDIASPRIYALNLPLILTTLNKNLVGSLRQSNIKAKTTNAGRALLYLENCIKYLEHLERGFNFLASYSGSTMNNFDAFYSKVEARLPDGREKSCLHSAFMQQREKDMRKINRLERERKSKGQ